MNNQRTSRPEQAIPQAVIVFNHEHPIDFEREAAPILDDLVVRYLRERAVDETQRLVEEPARAAYVWGTGGEQGDRVRPRKPCHFCQQGRHCGHCACCDR